MSTIEENIIDTPVRLRTGNRAGSILSRLLKLLCSVRFGVTLLCLLALACFLGMVIMQQNVDGFENYYATLTPAQRLVYGKLDLFDIYHAWYFNAILCVLSLNIILASIDRFPKTWVYVSKPQTTVPLRWLKEQKQGVEVELQGTADEVTARTESLLKDHGWKQTGTAEKNGRTYIFAQSGVWNRFGAYAVHVGLLTIFVGGFLTAQLGNTGNLPLSPGETNNEISETVVNLDKVSQITKRLPFDVTFTDIEQKLIKKEGSLSASNTIDWITRFTIADETGTHEAMVQMNRPYDYRGYRFFQASFTSIGRARNITVDATPAGGTTPERITIPRNEATTLSDGTKIRFSDFRGNFSIGPEDLNEDTSSYPNPAAVLQVVPPGGTIQTAYAFGPQMAEMPVAKKPVGGYTFKLADFEKVSDRHILSVQRDPGTNVVYVGFVILFLTLVAVFFFSHQRVWVVLEQSDSDSLKVTAGGDTNRSQNTFDEKFDRFIRELTTQNKESEAI
jgi:cytochrome c biogenesis protein